MPSKLFFTPGPAQLYFTAESHIKDGLRKDVASISHRSTEFKFIFELAVDNLKQVLNLPEGYHICFTSSATEIWERIAQSLVLQQSHHFINGSFAEKFETIVQQCNKKTESTNEGFGAPFIDLGVSPHSDLISVTYNETSCGFQFTQEQLKKLRDDFPEKLIALDIVSAAPATAIDLSLVDTAYFSVQKCFGLPAGLGVWIYNDRCLKRAEEVKSQNISTGSYHSLLELHSSASKNQTPATPNVLGIYTLAKVAGDMIQKGLSMMHRDTLYKSAILYQMADQLNWMKPLISEKANRSKTVCVFELEENNDRLMNQMEAHRISLGKGYGPFSKQHIRIANFPTHSKEQMEQLVDLISASSPK
jgi:phosphoserine aminotransferase